MTVFDRTITVVHDVLDQWRHLGAFNDTIALHIARRLAEEGLLIMDPLPDEDKDNEWHDQWRTANPNRGERS